MPKIKQSSESTVIDAQGNVQSHSENKVLSWGEEPRYVKLYLEDIMYLQDLPKQFVGVTNALLKRVSYASEENGMCVVLVPSTKREICKELGYKRMTSLNNALQKLLMGEIIYRVERGVYRFNPYLFGKGDWQDVAKLRLEINYDKIKGKTYSTNVEYAQNSSKAKKFKVV
jgi:hypothetical protein